MTDETSAPIIDLARWRQARALPPGAIEVTFPEARARAWLAARRPSPTSFNQGLPPHEPNR
jgi:hypothetical protein